MAGRYALLDAEEEEQAELRIVLVGKTGAGKSESGNTILGRKAFKSALSPSTVTTECQKEEGEFDSKKLVVVDTPGLFYTSKTEKKVKKEIARCISFAVPGPHVFLVVIQAGRFTQEEQKTVRIIQRLFEEKAARYTMVLFTRGDDMEANEVIIETFIQQDTALCNIIHQCGGRYHVFNNGSKDPSQVRELLEKINNMVQDNGGRYYTNEWFVEAKRAIIEKMKQLVKQNPQMTPQEARRLAERENWFIHAVLATAAAVPGIGVGAGVGFAVEVAIGAGVGAVGGPIGAAVGAIVGATVGAIAVAVQKESCNMQ